MDSFSFPRPFTRYPAGFRPVAPPSSGFRRFGSLTNVYGTDSPVEWPSSSRSRGGSVAPSPFSPVSSSPRNFSPPSSRNLFSPTYDNLPSPSSSLPRRDTPDTFLEKLRQQKEEIERWQPSFHSNEPQWSRQPATLHKTHSEGKLRNGGGTTLLMTDQSDGEWKRNGGEPAWTNSLTRLTHVGGREVPIQVQLDQGRVLTIPVQRTSPINENEWRETRPNGWNEGRNENGHGSGGDGYGSAVNGYGSGRSGYDEVNGNNQQYMSSTLPRGVGNGMRREENPMIHTTSPPPRYATLERAVSRAGRELSPPSRYSPPSFSPSSYSPASFSPPPPPPPPPSTFHKPRLLERTENDRRGGSVTPTRRLEGVPAVFHEQLLSAIPLLARERELRAQSPHRRSPVGQLFGPVGSKVKEAVKVNGFAPKEDVMSMSFPSYSHDEKRREEQRPFVSRPESPAAKLFSGLEERWRKLKEEVGRKKEEMNGRRNGEVKREDERVGRIRGDEDRREEEWNGYNNNGSNLERWNRRLGEEGRNWRSGEWEGREEGGTRMEPRGILRLRSESPTKRPSGRRVAFNEDDDVVVLSREGSSRGSPAPSVPSGDAPNHVRAFDDALEGLLSKWSTLGKTIGGDVEKATEDARAIFASLRSFLWTAAGRVEASGADLQKLLQPLSASIDKLSSWRESKRNTPFFNHVSAVAEGIPSVGWVTVKPTPAPYIKEMIDSSMFYVNRVLKDNKEHSEWVNTWKELLTALHTFVRQTHTTGLVWNSAPGAVAPAGAGGAVAAPKAGGPPPPPPGGPPPPPPPPPVDLASSSSSSGDKSGRDALFAELNQGENITTRLKKVTSDMQTHKNPSLRNEGTVGQVGSRTGGGAAKPAAAAVAKPPKTAFENGKQWTVEFHKNNREIIIEASDKKQTVYVYKCEGCVIQVKGKVNSVTLDGCKKTDIVLDAVVAQCETINCQSVKIQTLGEMPTVSIQKTDGCQVYLSEASRNAEIVTSKSSEMNVLVPQANGEFAEFPVPEQFKTVYNGGKLVTTVSDII